jgi:phosphocarrier protein
MLTREIIITNSLGLHARASAKWVNTASQFVADVVLEKAGQAVNGKSIMGVMMLAAGCGSRLQLQVDGPDEQQALQALITLVEGRFGEDGAPAG